MHLHDVYVVATRRGVELRPTQYFGPVSGEPLDVLRMLSRMGEGVVELGVSEAERVVRCGKREEGRVPAGKLEERGSHTDSLAVAATTMRPDMSDATVDVGWIAAHLEDPRVRVLEIDVSGSAYDQGHIPGAVLWNAYTDLREADYQPVGREALEDLVARSGIGADSSVVVYGYGSALGFWLLKAHGHGEVRMLAGARDEWVHAGHAWSGETPRPVPGTNGLGAETGDITATRAAVENAMGDSSKLLLDVRSPLEYSGERFWPSGASEATGRAGHIPGAISVPIDELRTAGGALKAIGELQRVFDDAGVTRDKTVITYCTIGNRASQAWFALKYLLGYPSVQVYYGSWVDWGKRTDTPIES
jgi:thiosulfate/3-mercaptopyruvate sulfurtransferase